MKNTFDLFALLKRLGMFGSYIDGEQGAGGDEGNPNPATGEGEDNDKFDVDLADLKKDNEESKTKAEDLEKRLADAEAKLKEAETEKTVQAEIKRLSDKHTGFDASAVKEKLEEIAKTDPDRAEELNSPTGWELLWVTELAPKHVDNDNPNFGRNVPPVDRSEEILKKVEETGVVSLADKKNVLRDFF